MAGAEDKVKSRSRNLETTVYLIKDVKVLLFSKVIVGEIKTIN